jgi:hypothetical protein
MRTVTNSTLSASARAEIGAKNKFLDGLKKGLEQEGFTILDGRTESETAAVIRVKAKGSDEQKVFRFEKGERTDITAALIEAGTPRTGKSQAAEFGHPGRSMFTRGAVNARVTGSYTDGGGKKRTTELLVSLSEAYQKTTTGKGYVATLADSAGKESLALRLSNRLGQGFRVRTVGEDDKGNYVMTAFNKKTGVYKRLVVSPNEQKLEFKTAESNRLPQAIKMVKDLEKARGHTDVRDVKLVSPSGSGDGLVFEVSYKTKGKQSRQFEVIFGHPTNPSGQDTVQHFNGDRNVTDRNTQQMVLKAVAQLLSNHSWMHEAHRIPGLTTGSKTTIVGYGEAASFADGGAKKPMINVQTVAIDALNRTMKTQWNQGDDHQTIDYTAQVLAAVKAQTGKDAFLGSHLTNRPAAALREQNTQLPIVTENGNIRVHSAGKDFVVDMERILAGKKTDLVMPDTSRVSMRKGKEVSDAPVAVPAS